MLSISKHVEIDRGQLEHQSIIIINEKANILQ